jgi:hypothetical protein
MYDYHYNQRLRPVGTTSALAFGVAVDAGLNVLLLGHKDGKADVQASVEAFRAAFKYEELRCPTFDRKDFDPRLVPEHERGSNLDYNAWKSLRVKGRLLIEEYARVILPEIEEVHAVQKNLDTRPGIIDAVVVVRGHGRVVLDNKTSANPYDADAVANDTQLALYADSERTEKAAFAVMVKDISYRVVRVCSKCGYDGSQSRHKTCPAEVKGSRCGSEWNEKTEPRPVVQLLVDKVPTVTRDLVKDSISQAEAGIKAGVYPRNLRGCGRIYGKRCPYFEKCWKGSDKGLETIKEKQDG